MSNHQPRALIDCEGVDLMRKIAATLTAVIVAVLLLGAGAAVGSAFMYPASADNPIASSGCVVRFDEKTSWGNTRPTIHANSSHFAVGCVSVSADYARGALVINVDTVGPIVGITSQPDETMTARGISCGPRGGMGHIYVYCYKGTRLIKAHSAEMYGQGTNLWISFTSYDRSAA